MPNVHKNKPSEDLSGTENTKVQVVIGFLNKNKFATVLLFLLLLVMIISETSIAAFGFEFGFKSNSSGCPEKALSEVAPTSTPAPSPPAPSASPTAAPVMEAPTAAPVVVPAVMPIMEARVPPRNRRHTVVETLMVERPVADTLLVDRPEVDHLESSLNVSSEIQNPGDIHE